MPLAREGIFGNVKSECKHKICIFVLKMLPMIVIIMIMIVRLVDTDHKITMDLEWKQPMRTYGDLKGYRWDYNDDHVDYKC